MDNKEILDFIIKYKSHQFYQPVVFKAGVLEIRGKWHNATIEFAKQLFQSNNIRSLLDVGCNVGFFLHEARRNNIPRVIGYEIDPYVLDIARDLNRIFQDGAIIEAIDLTKQSATETFDMTLLLNLALSTEQYCHIIKNIKSERFILEIPSNVVKEFSKYNVQLSNVTQSPRISGRTVIAEISF